MTPNKPSAPLFERGFQVKRIGQLWNKHRTGTGVDITALTEALNCDLRAAIGEAVRVNWQKRCSCNDSLCDYREYGGIKISDGIRATDTHTARLICVEKIEVKGE